MMEYLIYIAIVLMLGTIVSAFASKIKISNVLFLILIGMLLGYTDLISFTDETIITISTLALIMVVFDSSAKLKFKEIRLYTGPALKLALVFFLVTITLFSFTTYFLFGLKSILLAVLFSSIMYGIDPAVSLSMLTRFKNKAVEILEIESLINTPVTIIVSLLILKFLSGGLLSSSIGVQVLVFIKQVIFGLFVGVVLGFLLVRLMREYSFGELSYLTLITAAIISYVFAEAINGNGVLSVSMFGLIFGNYHVEHKLVMEKFASIFTNALKILVFVMIGSVLFIEPIYIVTGLLLFILYVLLRLFAVVISLWDTNIHFKEKIFMAFNVPKGIDVVIIILMMISTYKEIPGIFFIINLGLLFVFMSIALSTFVNMYKQRKSKS